MTGERWQEIRTVLEAALPMDSEKRSGYLDQACASDPSLPREATPAADSICQPCVSSDTYPSISLGRYPVRSWSLRET